METLPLHPNNKDKWASLPQVRNMSFLTLWHHVETWLLHQDNKDELQDSLR